jgi:hypothetical protein
MSHDKDTAGIRAQLGKASAMMGQIQAQHGEITKGATARLEQVTSRLEQLRPKVILDHAAADEYLELTKEKGALLRTLAMP